jgi:hypothetical protein
VVAGHIDATVRNIRSGVGHAPPPHLFLNQGGGRFADVAPTLGGAFASARVGRGLAYGDFDRDGDVDLLLTTNNGPVVLLRNDQLAGNKSVRLRLVGTTSNRDAIGALVRVFHGGRRRQDGEERLSYLSQSELPLTFGVGSGTASTEWSYVAERARKVRKGMSGAYDCVEGKGSGRAPDSAQRRQSFLDSQQTCAASVRHLPVGTRLHSFPEARPDRWGEWCCSLRVASTVTLRQQDADSGTAETAWNARADCTPQNAVGPELVAQLLLERRLEVDSFGMPNPSALSASSAAASGRKEQRRGCRRSDSC